MRKFVLGRLNYIWPQKLTLKSKNVLFFDGLSFNYRVRHMIPVKHFGLWKLQWWVLLTIEQMPSSEINPYLSLETSRNFSCVHGNHRSQPCSTLLIVPYSTFQYGKRCITECYWLSLNVVFGDLIEKNGRTMLCYHINLFSMTDCIHFN